jgi:hypothetical protein
MKLRPFLMATTVTVLAMLGFNSGCASSDSRLIGTWKSNRELTLPTFPNREQLTPDKRAFFDSIFGKVRVTYSARQMTTELPGESGAPPFRQSYAYRVSSFDTNSVTIRHPDPITGNQTSTIIHFEGTSRYWEAVGEKGGREYFDRVVE